MATHGRAGLGQVGGLVVCVEAGYGVPVMVPMLVKAIDRGPWPSAGFAEVVGVSCGPTWVSDLALLPVVPTR